MVGIDLSERMIDRSNERAKRGGVEDRVEFRVADAQNLPFEDNIFDAVICESVLAFIEDKQGTVGEFARVGKPGGYVGFNEVTWIKAPPPALVDYLTRTTSGEFLTCNNGWKELLEVSGLRETVAIIYKTTALSQWIS